MPPDTKDSDADPTSGKTGDIVLAAGGEDLTVDAGPGDLRHVPITDFQLKQAR